MKQRAIGLAAQTVLLLLAHSAAPAIGKEADVATLIANGDYAEAEARLLAAIPDPLAPVADSAAVQREILRRTRRDFSLTRVEVAGRLQRVIPDATPAEIDAWTASGRLLNRMIDGETRYFRHSVPNLFRVDAGARARREASASRRPSEVERYDLVGLLGEVLAASDASGDPLVTPVRHRVTYTLAVKPACERLRPGAVVRAWLPYPQEYRQQTDVRLIESVPSPTQIAPNGAPHRSLYYESVVGDDASPPTFRVVFEYVSRAYSPDFAVDRVEPYDIESELYRRYTAERLPHIAFTPEVRSLVREIVGEESNPLVNAQLLFRWVSDNLPWVREMEYSIIPSLSKKGIAARCGDCGVQGMTFITLCRAAGVPARWQSGFGTKPGEEGMHDWSEFYVEPWGWLPADASYGVQRSDDPRVRDFFCGRIDPYRLIVNLDYARPLTPTKTSFRSEPNDFQRGEVEIDGHNLYFDDWTYSLRVESQPRE